MKEFMNLEEAVIEADRMGHWQDIVNENLFWCEGDSGMGMLLVDGKFVEVMRDFPPTEETTEVTEA